MQETWYILENGASGDPNDVSRDTFGRLIHKSGVAVATGPHGYRSRGVDPVAERAKALEAATPAEPKPAKRGYATRDQRAG